MYYADMNVQNLQFIEEKIDEERDSDEVKYITGITKEGKEETTLITPPDSPAANYSFDVTPAKYITALITEREVCKADKEIIWQLYPEHIK